MSTKTQTVWEAYRFPIILFSAIVIGSIIGIAMGKDAAMFKPLGDIFLNLMFTIVVPLVFLTISSAVANMVNMKRLGSILKSMVLVFVVTGIISSVIMLFFVIAIPPAQGVDLSVSAEEPIEHN